MRPLYLTFLLLCSIASSAQDGLEGVMVETYYVSSGNETKGALHSGDLPEGSVTYRIYVDLKPGFTFQAAYGSPGHPLVIESTKPFFNHVEAGSTHPNILPERALGENIALLDSWLSVGAAGENHLGIPKEYDSEMPDAYVHFEPGYFTHKNRHAGFTPLMRDGMQRSEHLPFPTFYQMDSSLFYLGSSTNGNKITINNGAWACMGRGAVGADSLTTNNVLIAQLTTAGELSFELNLLIGAPNGTSQKYVARNPDPGEWLHKDLVYTNRKSKVKKEKNSKKKDI